MSGTTGDVSRDTTHRYYRPSTRGGFQVVPHLNGAGEEVYMVVAPTGVQLYMFEDIRDATAEAAELNRSAGGARRRRARGSRS